MAELRIFMVGGRRTGKTTILASMTENIDSVTSGTNLALSAENMGKKAELNNCINKLKDTIAESKYTGFYADLNPTDETSEYTYKLRTTNQSADEAISITFTDVPGEWFVNKVDEGLVEVIKEIKAEKGSNISFEALKKELEKRDRFVEDEQQIKNAAEGRAVHEGDLRVLFDESQVIIIAIDTPALMDDMDERDGFGRRHMRFNRVNEITDYITDVLTDKEDRLILFVPLKCEDYYHRTNDNKRNPKKKDYMNEDVNSAVKAGYERLIAHLGSPNLKKKCTVAITPIITVDALEFDEFVHDENAIDQDLKLRQKFFVTDDGRYAPKFCEQPLLYTLAFAVKKFKLAEAAEKAQAKEKPKGFFSSIFKKIISVFSRNKETAEEIEKLVIDLGALKKKGDGYEIVQNPMGL